jgi:hypothetical protein
MEILSAPTPRLTVAALVLGVVLAGAGCTGQRFDETSYLRGQAFYAANPKCLDEFRPCQSP